MPSRRTFLSTVGAVTGGVGAGCLSSLGAVSGYVQLKSIEGWYAAADGGGNDPIMSVRLSSPPGGEPELRFIDPEWEDRFDTPREPVVSDELHDDFDRTYDTIVYTVGVCSEEWIDGRDDDGEGCHNDSVSREEFNMVQVHDQASASFEDHDLSIHSREGTWTFESE